MTRITIQGADNWQQKPVISEARRLEIYGPIIPMAERRVGFWAWLRRK